MDILGDYSTTGATPLPNCNRVQQPWPKKDMITKSPQE